MQLRDILSPTNGLFSNMPQTIWGPDLDPSMIDIELFTRIGKLEASPLVDYYTVDDVLDTTSLAQLLFQRYGSNWKRIWDALIINYDITLTSTLDETRTSNKDNTNAETRNLMDSSTGTLTDEKSGNATNVKTGSVSTQGTNDTTRDLTDLETRALEKTNTGTVSDSGSETHTGTGSHAIDNGVYGVGSSALAPESQVSDAETRDFSDTATNTRTDNTTEADSGTLTTKKTGTEGVTDSSTETYDALTDTRSDDALSTETRNLTDEHTGTIGNVGSEVYEETFHSEGSSPLRTYQALIQEEISGRMGQGWNFTDIVIRDVQTMIASKIWRRTNG